MSSSLSLNFCMNYCKELNISKLKSICSVHSERPSIAKVTGTFLADVELAQAKLEWRTLGSVSECSQAGSLGCRILG